MTPKEQLAAARAFVDLHLAECCAELLVWGRDEHPARRVCPSGGADPQLNYAAHDALKLAERLVEKAAMRRVVTLT